MSASVNPDIVTDGLVLCLDAANSDCFRGEPTVNLVPNGNLYGMSNITLTFVEIENGWKKYSMSGTFTGGSYPYIMRIEANSFTSGVIYSSACTIKTNVLHKFNYFGTVGLAYVNVPRSPTGTQSSVINSDDSRTIKCENFAYTSTTVQNGYIWSNPINNTTFNSSTDFVWIKDLQIEQKPYSTQFVNGTRGSTVATGGGLVDLSGNNNHGTIVRAASPTAAFYNESNKGSLVFDGINDIVNTSYSVQGMSSFSTEVVFKTTTMYNTTQYYNCPAICGTAQGAGISGDWMLAVKNGNLISYDELTGGSNNINLNVFVSDNNWYFVQVTKNSQGIVTYYLNGVQLLQLTGRTSQLRTTSLTSTIYGTNWMVGSAFWTDVSYRNFEGSIGFNRLYNKALTAQEIQQNYKALKGRYGL